MKATKWTGTILGIIGAIMVASQIGLGYIPFFLGAVAYMIAGWYERDAPLFLLNTFFASINVYGMIQWGIL